MQELPGLVIIITDGRRARVVRPGPDNSLYTIEATDTRPAPGSGTAGAPTPGSTHPRRARTRAPAPDPAFLAELAARLARDLEADVFTDLVIVAPPRALHDLTARFDAATLGAVAGSLARNLIDVPDLELWPYLRAWVPPVRGK